MSDFYASRPQPLDQADGLRRLFAASRMHFVPVLSNPHLAFGGVMLERLCSALADFGQHVLLVDAGERAPAPHELAALELGACVEPLSSELSYLAARELPLRYVDTQGSTAGFLTAVADAAPQADVVLVHATAPDLSRLFMRRPERALLLAGDHPGSVTHAYAGMKLMAARSGLKAFDLLLGAATHSPRTERIAEQMARCADSFLDAVLHDWADIDPASDADGAGRAPGRSQAGPRPLGGPADVLVGRGADIPTGWRLQRLVQRLLHRPSAAQSQAFRTTNEPAAMQAAY